MHIRMMTAVFVIYLVPALPGAEPTKEIQFDIPPGWKSERIDLPPSFAPKMKLHGTEDVRFAPGMFQSASDTFFSYMFVFRVQSDPELSHEVIERELLVYYRGLATAVLKSRDIEVDTTRFALQLKEVKAADAQATGAGDLKQYAGDLDWIEPFVTREPQTLHLEIDAWANSQSSHNYLFVCVSPQGKKAAIWKTMHERRAEFVDANPRDATESVPSR